MAVITGICFGAHLGFAIPCLLYMLLVVVQSLWAGFGSSAIVSVIAAVCLEYFFIPPVLEWQIGDPEYGAALFTYCITSLVITRLASKARNEARVAEGRRRDVGLLYDVASRLLSLAPENALGPESLRIFQQVFGFSAVCVFSAESGDLRMEGHSVKGLAEKTKSACLQGVDYISPDQSVYVECLHAGTKPAVETIGAVGFEGTLPDASIAKALSILAGTAMERMRSFRRASRAAADAQTEMLRSAILDAFAHEFKTPLAIILAAAGGLREYAGTGDPTELTDIIENQTIRLNQLTTRLLRMAKLDRESVSPNMEATSLNALVRNLADQYQNLFDRRIVANPGSQPAEVLADSELLSLTINQLLDNACKYSLPDSVVTVDLDVRNGQAEVCVSNNGIPIRPEERERIFERFSRGTDGEQVAPGAGLGLYVARKIVKAHGGSLDLDIDEDTSVTRFRISLPAIRKERGYERESHQSTRG